MGGAANPVKDRVKSWDVKEYKIIDNGTEPGKFDVEWNLNKHWNQDELKRQLGIYNFDVLFCLEVFEYLYQPKETLYLLWEMLKLNGILYITFPFLYPVHEPREWDCLRYTRAGVTRLLTLAGFKILNMVDRNMKPESYAMWRAFIASEGMHASRGYTSHDSLGVIVKARKI